MHKDVCNEEAVFYARRTQMIHIPWEQFHNLDLISSPRPKYKRIFKMIIIFIYFLSIFYPRLAFALDITFLFITYLIELAMIDIVRILMYNPQCKMKIEDIDLCWAGKLIWENSSGVKEWWNLGACQNNLHNELTRLRSS